MEIEMNQDEVRKIGAAAAERADAGITRRQALRGLGTAMAAAVAGSSSNHIALVGAEALAPKALREIRLIENVWIPMSDGVRIAARVWLPVDAEINKVPAIMEYIPYRKRDGTRGYDDPRMKYWAARGYAYVRPDIRGSGDSEGILVDEYVKQEQDDGVEIIRWLARQPWSSGSVGMVGISWGGFSALQVAARRPPELKAIITHCSTDDRYATDAHYIGGCILQDMFLWGGDFFSRQASPPDPEIVGAERWQSMWMERLEKLECRVADWMQHQHRDAFWKHGSVSENYDAIQCPVYAIGGWVDPYAEAIPRMMRGLQAPRLGLIGPWAHDYPNNGVPGPTINYYDHALRWWDQWLKGIDTGIRREPMVRVWMQEEAPCCGMTETPGRWVAEKEWPSPRIKPRRFYLSGDKLTPQAGPENARELAPAQTIGMAGGNMLPGDMNADLPKDQRLDDGRSLCFDSEPLTEEIEILGASIVELDLAVDKPVALVAVRLNEVSPDGASRRVTYGVLNLTHRNSHESPAPLVPGKRYRVPVQLKDIAHSFSPGNRLRVAVSTSYWPMVLPSPEAVRLTLYSGPNHLLLPVRTPATADTQLTSLGTGSKRSPRKPARSEEPSALGKHFVTDLATGKVMMRIPYSEYGGRIAEIGTIVSGGGEQSMDIFDDDPEGATVIDRRWRGWERGDWRCRVDTQMKLTLERTEYLLEASVEARGGEKMVFTRTWNHRIPRRLV